METEIFWNAVKTNDANFDGAFFYGVKTTKIYCKPSCGSKQPKRENIAFFTSFADAETKGFRACRRCEPKSEKIQPQTEIVLPVCRILENDGDFSLENLADKVGVSPAHLQKVFKKIIGVSPKKFAEMKRLERFKEELRNGNDVTSSVYEVGFNSGSRLYENVSKKLGMTPKVYAEKGKNMKIEYAIADCDLGKLLVAKTEKGVCAVSFGDDEKTLSKNLSAEYYNAQISHNENSLKSFIKQISANLAGKNKTLNLPLDLQATAFQMRVWETLRKIPYGKTVSYKEVAEKIGNKKAVRAVAQACSSNRTALVIPCHRVVRENGDLSGYRWGTERKKAILKKEKEIFSEEVY